ncbi:hypothetical protein PF005_g5013 [Phytophthora fragariae]|uniref:Agenet domain-containing protein n=1 Tax=Phytophthora fragariae TaxID=53985 RepID=A0A6A3FHS3_9STRA|nr:hypothetical protein PF003_g34712 [Phytophthora fragariae]KAE8945385.1 hypothetical protein PF009_g4961 [Phytophthora fragariae]KAE9022584.1 hypothetical protein PF011_g4393 [Phytophthora fragariae]KAE9127465.1 hypothetical protein PF007_g5607 [Phytophthora fragariae]KAE9129635.1 hypothetical protein PF010_g4120 [Phytophthora fragariae]
MAELSFLARLVLTLLLSAASLFVYKRLQTSAPAPASQSSTKRAKKRSKKKSGKKSAAADSPASSPPPSQNPAALTAAAAIADDDDASESDSDDGLSAAQVLATRTFKPKSLGGSRLARKIKASLPPADAPRFAVSQPVLARFGGGDQWFPATVLEQRKGNEYHLKYDDGEVEYRVPAEFIKLKPTKSEGSGDSDKDEVMKDVTESVGVQEKLSDSDSSQSDDDDGWQMVGTSTAAKRQARRAQAAAGAAAPAEVLVDGLTKRQRESRRKKERLREKKELLRQHAQKDDLNARARWRYVPS